MEELSIRAYRDIVNETNRSLNRRANLYRVEDQQILAKTRPDFTIHDLDDDYKGLREKLGDIAFCMYSLGCRFFMSREKVTVAEAYESHKRSKRYKENMSKLERTMQSRRELLGKCHSCLVASRAEYHRENKAGRIEAAAKHYAESNGLYRNRELIKRDLAMLEKQYSKNSEMYLAMEQMSHNAKFNHEKEIDKKTIGKFIDKKTSVKAKESKSDYDYDYHLRLAVEGGSEVDPYVLPADEETDNEFKQFMNSDTTPSIFESAVSSNDDEDDAVDDIALLSGDEACGDEV